ncbi:MAG: hypothetical protein AAGA92_13860 [Planctomycetota bacterium]
MAATLLILASLASFQAAEPETPAVDEAEAVAEEIIRIREALGGSIVEEPPAEGVQEESPRIKRRRGPRPPRRQHPVFLLRETALRLDVAAHRLETAELYQEADRLRATAHSLRLSARDLSAGRGAAQEGAAKTPHKPQD